MNGSTISNYLTGKKIDLNTWPEACHEVNKKSTGFFVPYSNFVREETTTSLTKPHTTDPQRTRPMMIRNYI